MVTLQAIYGYNWDWLCTLGVHIAWRLNTLGYLQDQVYTLQQVQFLKLLRQSKSMSVETIKFLFIYVLLLLLFLL